MVIGTAIFVAAFGLGCLWSKSGYSSKDFLWIFGAVLAHDAYFYWCHRLLHHRKFWRFHRIHHTKLPLHPLHSLKVSPVEAIIEAVFMPAAVLLTEPNLWAFVTFALVMMATNWWGHSGAIAGFIPRSKIPFVNQPDDHRLHHDLPAHNLTAYFTFWDYVGGTRWQPEIEKWEIKADDAAKRQVEDSPSGAA